MEMPLTTLFMTLVMALVIMSPPVVQNTVPKGISCKAISCDRARISSDNCPQWNFCNLRTGFCSPCGQCNTQSDEDSDWIRNPTLNCRDPTYCVTNYHPIPNHSCPWLKVKEGYQCSGDCSPCGSPFGYFLGTTCRVDCADGDFEVFSCIFLNEYAQWNISRRPRWIDYEHFTPPPRVTTHSNDEIASKPRHLEVVYPTVSTVLNSGISIASSTKSEFSEVIMVSIVVAFLIVVVMVTIFVATCWYRNRTKPSSTSPGVELSVITSNAREEGEDSSPRRNIQAVESVDPIGDENNNSSMEPRSPERINRIPIEMPGSDSIRSEDILEAECLLVEPRVYDHTRNTARRPEPTEHSDTHCSGQSSRQPEKSFGWNFRRPSLTSLSTGEIDLNLVSDDEWPSGISPQNQRMPPWPNHLRIPSRHS